MQIIKTRFDGKKVVIPQKAKTFSPREVFVIFEDDKHTLSSLENENLMALADSSFNKIWDNEEDAIYDSI